MVKSRKGKKVPCLMSDRPPLVQLGGANEDWSMEFVFDRIADGRALKYLTVVDEAKHASVPFHPDTAISGADVTWVPYRIKFDRTWPR